MLSVLAGMRGRAWPCQIVLTRVGMTADVLFFHCCTASPVQGVQKVDVMYWILACLAVWLVTHAYVHCMPQHILCLTPQGTRKMCMA